MTRNLLSLGALVATCLFSGLSAKAVVVDPGVCWRSSST